MLIDWAFPFRKMKFRLQVNRLYYFNVKPLIGRTGYFFGKSIEITCALQSIRSKAKNRSPNGENLVLVLFQAAVRIYFNIPWVINCEEQQAKQ